jgi:hypothetical protein
MPGTKTLAYYKHPAITAIKVLYHWGRSGLTCCVASRRFLRLVQLSVASDSLDCICFISPSFSFNWSFVPTNLLLNSSFSLKIKALVKNDLYKKRLVSRINPSLLLKINLQNTWILQLNNIYQVKSKWNYLQKIIQGPASLSIVHW